MKVVCTNNIELGRDSNGKPRHNTLPLTIGKTYEIDDKETLIVTNVRFYLVEDNNGVMNRYPAQLFLPLHIWREMQINRII